MKKLIAVFTVFILLLTIVGCTCGSSQTAAASTRGELSVAYDRELTKELLAYFQVNQGCIVTGTLLNEETDYAALSGVSAALVKDEAVAEKLKAAGWIETTNWTDLQKETNANMFDFIVLTAPDITDSGKTAAKYLTDWLVGDGAYDRTVTTVSGGCGCRRTETNVTMHSDAPELFKSGLFADLVNP